MTFSQVTNFSSPMTYLVYRLVCLTLVSMRDGVNMSSKTSEGDSGTATVGPTGDDKSLIETELSMDDH